MTWHQAPLYVDAHTIAVYLAERLRDAPSNPWMTALQRRALALVEEVGLALTFPARRAAHLQRADEAALALRLLLRVARDLGLLSPGATRHLAARVEVAGRMLGGWQRQQNLKRTGLEPKRRAARAAGRQLQEHNQELPVGEAQQEHA